MMLRSLRRFSGLRPEARRLVVAAAALQMAARAGLRLCGLPVAVRTATMLARRSRRVPDPALLVWALAASAVRVRGTCLTQALAALALGARDGAASRLVIGVRHAAGVPEFHAWAEIDGLTMPATNDAASFAALKVWN